MAKLPPLGNACFSAFPCTFQRVDDGLTRPQNRAPTDTVTDN